MFNKYIIYDELGNKIMSCFAKESKALKESLKRTHKENYTLNKCKVTFFAFFRKELRNFISDILDSLAFILQILFSLYGLISLFILKNSGSEISYINMMDFGITLFIGIYFLQ